MKLAFVSPTVFCAVLAGCASTPKPEPAAAPTLTSAEAPDARSPIEKWADAKAAAAPVESSPKHEARESLDPLDVGSELEASAIPTIEMTPANQVRGKSPSELNAAVSLVKSAASVDDAAQRLTQRLGKPNWTEAPKSSVNAKRRIWVATGAAQCHRLVLESDGSVDVESVSKSEWQTMTASARQNPCTGEIKRGISK